MGLFTQAKQQQPQWTVPDTPAELALEMERLTAVINGTDKDAAVVAKTQRDMCENAVALKAQVINGSTEKATLPPCSIREYNMLLERVRAFGMEDVWLRNSVEQWQMAPENFSAVCYGHINKTLCELEARHKEVQKEKKREAKERAKKEVLPWEWPGPAAPVGMKAVAKPNGTFTHVTTTEPEFNKEEYETSDDEARAAQDVRNFGKRCGLEVAEVDEAWNVISARHGNVSTRTTFALWQARMTIIAGNNHKKLTKEAKSLTETTTQTKPVAAAVPKVGGLFSGAKKEAAPQEPAPTAEQQTTAAPTAPATPGTAALAEKNGAAPAAAPEKTFKYSQEEYNEVCEALGIKPTFEVKTREDADWVMGKIMAVALQLEYIITRYTVVKPQLERQFEAVRERFDDRLNAWAKDNLDGGKKSTQMLWGSLGYENQAESVALDENDKDELALQGWIHCQSQEFKTKIGANPVPRYTRDMKVLKAWVLERKAKGADIPPGLRYTPAATNKFYIRPSLATLKDQIKKGAK